MPREYYETRTELPDIQYSAGPILSVGGVSQKVRSGLADVRSSRHNEALQGYVVRFQKPHAFNGGIDIFVKGCFDASLASRKRVGFWIAHENGSEIASTDGNLELVSDETGLAFRLNNPPSILTTEVRNRKLTAMSAGYTVLAQEFKVVAGERVRFIQQCDLDEISICRAGAVRQAFIDVVDTGQRGSLRDDVKARRVLADGAHVALMRALQKLDDR